MKNKVLYALVMISLTTSLFAQPSFEWVRSVGGSGTDYGHQTVIDPSGNIIAVGYFQDIVDFDPTVGVLNSISNGGNDFFVQKYDDNGNFLWAKTFGGISADGCRSVSCDANGNIYLTGIFSETVDFDPGPGVANYTANGNSDIYILKLDTNGNLVWIKVVGGPSSDGAYGITNDLNNNVVVTGIFANTVDFDPGAGTAIHSTTGASDIFTLKLDENGDFVWVRVVLGQSGSGNYGYSVTTDSNGNVITAGQFGSSSSDFDPGAGVSTLSSNGSSDVFIQKLDQNGNFLWAKSFGGTNIDYVFGLDTDDLGNIITAGQFRSTVDFDTGAGLDERIPVGSTDLFVHKLDALGNFVWVRTLGSTGGEDARSIATDANGNIYVSGIFEGSMDFDPGTGTHIGTSQGNFDMFIQKFDGAGNFIWNNTFGGIGIDASYGCSVNSSGSVVLTGAFSNTVDFDSGSNVYNQTSNGERDIYVLKLQECVPTFSTQSHTACSSYMWNGTTYNSTGTYTYVTTNAAGCDSTATLNLTIEDATAPVPNMASLSNVTSECSVTSLTAPTATDNCAGTITGTHNATLPITTQGTTVVTWTYNDGNGNTSTQTQNVVIDDVTAPVANMATLADVTSECSVTSLTAPTATDNCAGTITGTHNATLPITSQGITVVTWTYNDGNGNTSTQTQNVVIDDVTAPVANVASLPDFTSECSVTSLTAPTATDNCAGTITGTHNATLPITTQGTTVVTWTYNDGNGNTSTQTQNVVIDDVTAPVANVASLSDVTSECSVTSLTAPTATDNCAGTITGTHNATLPITAQGTTVVTWTFNDGNGNSSTQTQNVVIDDLIAPVANVVTLSDVTSECSVTTLTAPTATDNCAGTITGTHNATLPITAQGTTVVTWTYDDGNGNISTQTQNVVIDDVSAPVANMASLSNVTSECSVTSLTAPTATDNCSGTITGTHNATLPITTQGTTVVTWTYNDGNGNTSTQTQNVVIDDVTSPVADLNSLADILALCEVNNLNLPTATDNCAGSVAATHNVTLPLTVQGTTVVTWTYDDGNGNISTQTQNVIISGPNAAVTQVDEITLTADLTGADYQWVDCNNGYQFLNGETNQTFVATANGSYAVIVDNGTCADTSNCFVISTVGLDEKLNSTQINVYPNPTNGAFTIDLGEHCDEISIRLMNSLGQIVERDQFESVDKINLTIHSQPGIYFLEGQINQSQTFRINIIKQ